MLFYRRASCTPCLDASQRNESLDFLGIKGTGHAFWVLTSDRSRFEKFHCTSERQFLLLAVAGSANSSQSQSKANSKLEG